MTAPRFLVTAAALIVASLGTTKRLSAADQVDYVTQIKPLLAARCFACHGVLQQQGALRLDTAEFARKGGDSGPAVSIGKSAESLLVQRILGQDGQERMPPEGEPFSAVEIDRIRAWIDQGAVAPGDEKPEPDPREHWAFRVPVRPSIPAVGPAHPIDAFVEASLIEQGLKPLPAAEPATLLRRVYLDLIGLPPTREQIAEFLADPSDQAFARTVDRLLDSPQYGERWGRHWMDIWRYSDWWGLGAEVRNSQKHIWHWRDWIVESLNQDKGYDQMLREMLAADELYPNDLDRLRASGFLARHYFKFNRTSWLDETIEHTSKAFLGLTLNCGKCHDHKYDPFSQTDYYELRAFFEPYQIRTEMLAGESDFEQNGLPRAFDCNLDTPTYRFIRGDDRQPDKSRALSPALPDFLAFDQIPVEQVKLPPEAFQPGLRPFVESNLRQRSEGQLASARQAVESARQELSKAETQASRKETTSEPQVVIKDDFSKAVPNEQWDAVSGQWEIVGGHLHQRRTGAERGAIRLRSTAPRDFEANFRFEISDGQMWKSVGMTFDGADNREILVYLSAYAGGPKAQVSYRTPGADHNYPPDGHQARAVGLNQPQELVVRIRDRLINVLVNGEPSVSYRLPIARESGRFELITFDAAAKFLGFELKTLPEDVVLTEPAKPGENAPPGSVEQARAALAVAERRLVAAELEPEVIKARAAADRARWQPNAGVDTEAAAGEAARQEKALAVAQAEAELAQAELDLLKAAPAQKPESEKKLAAARDKVAAQRKQLESPGSAYTSLNGALKTLENNTESEDSRRKPFPETSTGRRTALARWITDPRNPLTARVAVNHLWSRHLGRPLVPTVFDFGRKGTPPTHPELLDYLAVELMEHGWSTKHLHRLIVTSQAYGRTSSSVAATDNHRSQDPENKLYWRRNPLRMEAQLVRDNLLFLSGELDLTLGGPSIPVADEASKRRSLYFVHSHNEHQKFLAIFDDANVLECYRRPESIVPQQALALSNSKLVMSAAEKITARLQAGSGAGDDPLFVRTAWETILSTAPTSEELAACEDALRHLHEAAQAQGRTDSTARARIGLVQALLNHNDFVTIR